MLGVGALPPLFLGVGVLAMPESPRWLVMMGRLGDAKRVLDKTSNSVEESRARLADIKEAVLGIPPTDEEGQEHEPDTVPVPNRPSGGAGSGVWRELLLHPTPTVRHILIAAVGIHFFQQASGIDSVVMYSPRIFEKAGITKNTDKLLATIAVGFSKTIFILVATFLLDKHGRRVLLLSSAAGMAISLIGLATGLTIIENYGDHNHKLTWAIALCIACTLSSVGFFSIGMGPIAWVYSSEVFPLRLRAQGCGLGVAANRLMSGILLIVFIPLYKAITIGGAFYLFSGITMTAWIFFYTLLPETRGRTLEEMQALFGTFFKWRSTTRELDSKNRGEK